MDSVLVDYLQSGKAWILVGSGPSVEMEYPSWEKLAACAMKAAQAEKPGVNLGHLNRTMQAKDYPRVFQEAEDILGIEALLKHLRQELRPGREGRIYDIITRWPINVYLTTNYDNELQEHLVKLGVAYIPHSNSEEHLSLLIPSLTGAIFKLHGDLTSDHGLVLTTRHYQEIVQGQRWEYWRTKMTSVFQMNPVVVIGLSLADRNIQQVLEAAKKGSGVTQPVCWLAPDVSESDRRTLLDRYRINVISYENKDGRHDNLVRLLENVDDFVVPRMQVQARQATNAISSQGLKPSAAAPGLFVFNAFCSQSDFDKKRLAIVSAIVEAMVPELKERSNFTLEQALELAGWPTSAKLEPTFVKQVRQSLIDQGVLEPSGDGLKLGTNAQAGTLQSKQMFDHMHDRFRSSLLLRLKRRYSALSDQQAAAIASQIEASLIQFFRECGLSLATTLLSRDRGVTVPSSIIPYVKAASTTFGDLLMRQAFFTVSVDVFVHPESADRDYLGRLSQGFFAFHALGTFGGAAKERLDHAKETVWLVDSDTQIRLLALGSTACATYRDCFSRLRALGIRFFTTARLFEETREHLWFANNVIEQYGEASHQVMSAAKGDSPYRKSNKFLEGFVSWQAAGNQADWGAYLFEIFRQRKSSVQSAKEALNLAGIEGVALSEWPGFSDSHHIDVQTSVAKIVRVWEELHRTESTNAEDETAERKAQPEAEALNIVRKEREGLYHILSDVGQNSPAWFISYTSILNLVDTGSRITWQPDAFLRFASTLCDIRDAESAEQAFEMLVLGIAQSGLNLLDEDILARVFARTIDQAKLNIAQLSQQYHETLEKKYGESLEKVLSRLPSSRQPLAAIQLANELAEAATVGQRAAEKAERSASKRAADAERKLAEVDKYRRKMEAKEEEGKRKARKPKAKKKKKKTKKK